MYIKLYGQVQTPGGKVEVPHQSGKTHHERYISYFSCSIARIYLNAKLLSLLPQPADKVPQPHDVIAVIDHRQPFTQKKHTNNTSTAEVYMQ